MVSRDFPKGLGRMAAGWRNVRGTSPPSYQTFCQTSFTKYLFLLIGSTWRTRCPRGSMIIITTTMEGGKDSIRILRNFENSPCIRDGGESQNARGCVWNSPPGFSFSSGNLSVKYICRAAFAVNFLNKRWEGMENMRHFPRFITGIANYLTRLFPIFRRFRYESLLIVFPFAPAPRVETCLLMRAWKYVFDFSLVVLQIKGRPLARGWEFSRFIYTYAYARIMESRGGIKSYRDWDTNTLTRGEIKFSARWNVREIHYVTNSRGIILR